MAGVELASATGVEQVRAELHARIAAIGATIDRRARRVSARDLAPEIDAIRLLAHRAGMAPAVTVAHFIDSALSRGERGALVHGWLTMLRDAVGSERQDLDAAHAFAAACSVRLSS